MATYIKHKFLTFDFTNRTDVLQTKPEEARYLYRDNKKVLPEYYFWADDQVDVSSDYEDIVGMQLNDGGTVLAIWSDTNQVYIYKRPDPHCQAQVVPWTLEMVIHDIDSSVEDARDRCMSFFLSVFVIVFFFFCSAWERSCSGNSRARTTCASV